MQIYNKNTEQQPQEERFGNLWRCLHDHFTVSYVWLTLDTGWKIAFLKVNDIALFSVDDSDPFLSFLCVCMYFAQRKQAVVLDTHM